METIKKNEEFQYIYKNSLKISGKYFIAYIIKSSEKKFGTVASKKVGNAVKRNRIKRIYREIIRKNEKFFKNFKIIIIAKSFLGDIIKTTKYIELENDFLKVMKLKGIIKWLK